MRVYEPKADNTSVIGPIARIRSTTSTVLFKKTACFSILLFYLFFHHVINFYDLLIVQCKWMHLRYYFTMHNLRLTSYRWNSNHNSKAVGPCEHVEKSMFQKLGDMFIGLVEGRLDKIGAHCPSLQVDNGRHGNMHIGTKPTIHRSLCFYTMSLWLICFFFSLLFDSGPISVVK